jgi:hypothetical protein
MIKQFTKEVITGMLLSDGHLSLGKEYKNVRFYVGLKKLEFSNKLYDIMKSDNLVKANIKKYDYLDIRNKQFYKSYRFATLVNPYSYRNLSKLVY